uniref:Uncharacterized protein n=1 Tax=Schizaphis graminum TaxID=13262 RepID=A0A2S2NB26_SCHGA
MLDRNIKYEDKSLNIVNQYKQSEDVIQNNLMQFCDNDDNNTLILNSQQFQPVTDLHIQLENSDQKEDFLNVSQFSDIIATLDEQNHNIFNIENDLLDIKSIFL